MWYLGDLELGAQTIAAAHYSDLAVVYFGGQFRLYYQVGEGTGKVKDRISNDL